MIIRLNKYISECGIASRRKSDELISNGRVSVNGSIILELGTKVNTEIDEISIDGELLKKRNKVYFLLNKPKGVITTTVDDKNRTTVTDLINTREKIFPVGRLDFNTTGVLLLTNDGELTNFLTHPKNGFEREYEVILDKPLEIEDKIQLLKGVYLEKRKSLFTKIEFPKKNNFVLVRVTTVEGRNHFVKKMFDTIGYRVKELHRLRYGKFIIKNMRRGEYRIVTPREIKSIMKNNISSSKKK